MKIQTHLAVTIVDVLELFELLKIFTIQNIFELS